VDPRTETDRFILEQTHGVLVGGERVMVCAYLTAPIKSGGVGAFVEAAKAEAAFAALTDRALLLVRTRVGAVRPLLENHGVTRLDHGEILGVHLGTTVVFELADGRMLEFRNDPSDEHVSTQREFFERLHGTFGTSKRAAAKATRERELHWVATGIGLALAAAYVAYRLMAE